MEQIVSAMGFKIDRVERKPTSAQIYEALK